MHDVVIRRVTNGFVVTVGCLTFVFETQASLMGALNDYLANPAVAIKNWQPIIDSFHRTQGGEDVPEEEPFRGPAQGYMDRRVSQECCKR